MNTGSTECSPQNDLNFDEIFSKPKEGSEFNFLDEKSNYINNCKNSLNFDINENEINPKLKREASYSDLNIHMKKEEEFNLKNVFLKKENITNDIILSYIMEEMNEKIFIEEDYKYNDKEMEELFYSDEEEEEDDEMINAILMYNNRNTSHEFKKILRERLKKRIKEDEKKYKKEEKLYKENEKKREKKIKKKKKEISKSKKECDNGSLYKLLNSDLIDESLYIKYLSIESEGITSTLINLSYNKKNIRKFIPNILHEIISIYYMKNKGYEYISKFLIDCSIKNVAFGIKICLIILSLSNLVNSKKLIILKNQIESNISLLTNDYNLKKLKEKNLSIYDIKTIEELELFDENNNNEENQSIPDYVFFLKYFELNMEFYNDLYLLPKKIEQFIEKNIINKKNEYKVSKMDNHSLIQTEFINKINELNNKIRNLYQYIEQIKNEVSDKNRKKNILMNLFTGYFFPLDYLEKNYEYTFDIDDMQNNFILVNIISDSCELNFPERNKYLKNFEIKFAFEIIQLKDIKSYTEVINQENIKNFQKITISSKKKKEIKYDPFNYIFNGNPNLEYLKNNSFYNKFNSHNITFYNLVYNKDITGDIVINKFKKYFNNLFLSKDNEINENNDNYIIKIPDIIPINQNCFLKECINYNYNLVSLKQIENDLKIYQVNKKVNYKENKENISINKRQINNKYKLYEEPDIKDLSFSSAIYEIFLKGLVENDETLQKNLIESFIYNILLEFLFNNKAINSNIYQIDDNTDIFNDLYIDKNGFLYLIKENNHYLSTDNSLMNNKFKINNKLMKLMMDNDVTSDSFQYFINLIVYYICEIKKYYYTFENYINVYLNGIRPSNWSNKLKDWVLYSLQERFFLNKTDEDITSTFKKNIYGINVNKSSNISKFKFLFDTIKSKIYKNEFN